MSYSFKPSFCINCGHDLTPVDCNEDGTVICPGCSDQSKALADKMLAFRALKKFIDRKDCCKDEANLSLRAHGIVKCMVCGARNIAHPHEVVSP